MMHIFALPVFASAALAVACASSSAGDGKAGVDSGLPAASGGSASLDGGAGGRTGAGTGGSLSNGGSPDSDSGGRPVPPFERPDATPYTPQAGTCGLDAPAFCDTFETGPKAGGRSAELEPSWWSATRGDTSTHPSLTDAFPIGPAVLPACRSDLPAWVWPDQDAVICDPTSQVSSRHLLTSTAAQNYGLSTYRIRQPFDFSGRTGTIKLDVDLTNDGLGGWPAVVISEDPSPAPSFDWEERGSGPRNGIELEFMSGWCNAPQTVQLGVFTFRDYVQTATRPSFDCETPHATTVRGSLNHVEIYLTAGHVEVWASDASPDGVEFPNFHLLYEADLALPFERGYMSLAVRNHATMKYWRGSAWNVRWDNVGFDGPVVTGFREHDVPDSLVPVDGLDGCRIDGICRFRGDVIVEHPGDDSVCPPDASCTLEGQRLNVGYVVPRDDETPARLVVPGVSLDGATRARLVLAATYPWFEWNGVNEPPTAMNLQYRVNGGPFHDRFVTAVEANAFTDYHPELGGAGHGAGLLNQVIDLDLAELTSGDNVIELRTQGTWTGEYRAGVTGVTLLLTTE